MSRFREEISVIPGIAWAIVVVVYVSFVAVLLTFVAHQMPGPVRYVFGLGIPLIFCVFLLLTGYVYGDAKRRGMRAVMWTFLVFLIPNAIGFILYFIMREPLMTECRQCRRLVRGQFGFCPFCGAGRTPACPQCRKPVESDWANCAHCGVSLSAAPS
jgi:RNA polymerase subunit RPABC4/transcription elongation factor Spt4